MLKKLSNYFVLCAVAIVSVMMLSACSDDKDEKQSDAIVGKWKTTYTKEWHKVEGVITDEDVYEDEVPDIWEFFNDGTFVNHYDYNHYDESGGQYKLSGGKLSMRWFYNGEIDYSGSAYQVDCSIKNNEMIWIDYEEWVETDEYEPDYGKKCESYCETHFTRVS